MLYTDKNKSTHARENINLISLLWVNLHGLCYLGWFKRTAIYMWNIHKENETHAICVTWIDGTVKFKGEKDNIRRVEFCVPLYFYI